MISQTAEHANRTAFLFVPNLCNAACSFCYVLPSSAGHAMASPVVVARARVVAEALDQLGFAEVRFTGGEPTLFTNFEDLVTPFLNRGFRYRVLTNGLDIDSQFDFLSRHPPERITLSVHSTRDPGSHFGVDVDARALAGTRRRLATLTELEATLVVSSPTTDSDDISATIAELKSDGVKHIKLIQENSTHGKRAAEFARVAARLHSKWARDFRSFRVTDPRIRACILPRKSFPSFELGRGRAYACCVQVGDQLVPDGYSVSLSSNPESVCEDLERMANRARTGETQGYPCAAASMFCPLALR